jgi:hypothetical protein
VDEKPKKKILIIGIGTTLGTDALKEALLDKAVKEIAPNHGYKQRAKKGRPQRPY